MSRNAERSEVAATPSRRRPGTIGASLVGLLALLLLVGVTACRDEPEVDPLAGLQPISQDAVMRTKPVFRRLIDVRTPEEWAAGRIPHSVNIPHDELADRIDEIGLLGDVPVIVYCESGVRARKAAAVLLAAGYQNVRHLEGDMRAWREAGLPVAR